MASENLALWSPWSQLPHEPVHNPILADSVLLYLPWSVFARGALGDGEWPLWDPYSFAGFPYAGNSLSQLYYPLTWLGWLLPISGAIQMLALANICVAGWGMYVFSRGLDISRVGALLAGLAFAGSGMLQLAIESPSVASVYGWLPWMLFATHKALERRSARWSAVAALLCGVQAVAGQLQWVLYSYFALACWILWLSALRGRGEGLRASLGALLQGGAILVGGLALAAIHLAPFAELVGQATRTGGRVSSNSWPLDYLLRMLMPQFFGTAAPGLGVPMVFNDLWYVGVAPLVFAFFALILRPRRQVWLWFGLALLAVLVTYGIGPFLYARWLPGLNALLPMRIGYLLILAVAVLCGFGYDGWLRLASSRPKMAAILLAGLTALFAAIFGSAWLSLGSETDSVLVALKVGELWRGALLSLLVIVACGMSLLRTPQHTRRGAQHDTSLQPSEYVLLDALTARPRFRVPTSLVGQGIAALLLVVAGIDLLTAVPGYNSFVAPERVLPSAPSLEWLRAQPGNWRVMPVDNPVITLNPNSQLLMGIPSVDGYDSLHTRRYEEFWGAVDITVRTRPGSNPYSNIFIRPQAYTSTLASLLGVRYIASVDTLPPTEGFTRVYSGEISIYENAQVLPRAFLVARAETLPLSTVKERLSQLDFDPLKTVLLEAEESPPAEVLRDVPSTASDPPGRVDIRQFRRNSVTLSAELERSSWLVLSDPNYPGWSASVDGREERVYTAYGLLRAVHLSAGRHTVVFSYLPSAFLPAGVVSGATLAVILAVIILGGRSVGRRRTVPRLKGEK